MMPRWRHRLVAPAFALAALIAVCVWNGPSWVGRKGEAPNPVMMVQTVPPASRPEDGDDETGAEPAPWASDARKAEIERLIAAIEADYPKWEAEEKPIQRSIVSGLRRIDRDVGDSAARALGTKRSPESCAAGRAVWQALRDLHALTGRCEFVGLTREQALSRAPEICGRYRAWLAGLGDQDEAARMRAAIYENIALLQTDRWWPAFEYIQDHIALSEWWQIHGEGPTTTTLPEKAAEYLHTTMLTWWTNVSPELEWDPAGQQFIHPGSPGGSLESPLDVEYMWGLMGLGKPIDPSDVPMLKDPVSAPTDVP